MAGACVRVDRDGHLTRVYYQAPGTTGPTLCYSVFTRDTEHLAEADARRLTEMLAPLIDIGMRHAEARRPAPRPLPCDPDPNDADPDD